MIDITRLRLHLPAGFERRAARIARLVGDELARLPVASEVHADSLHVRGLEISPALSDRRAAARIASAIHRQAQAPQG